MTKLTLTAGQIDTTLTSDLDPAKCPTELNGNGLVTRKVTALLPYGRNSRVHGEAQIAQIAASIGEFGFTNPVLIDERDTIIAGEGRVLAAKKLKMPTVPCVVLAGLTEAQKAAYVIADNKLALNAGWDEEMLHAELGRLAELKYDLNLTGFSEVEIAALLDDIGTGVEELANEAGATQPETGQPEASEAAMPEAGQQEAQNAWRGMPEFNQPEAGPFRTITVHFKDQAAVDAFAELIGQTLTDKTKWVWYPEVVRVKAAVVYA